MVERNANANKHDIVYMVKESLNNEELRYSLRSLKNFPHRKVWFYGGCPEGLKPDHHIYVNQNQANKWLNVNMMLKLACNNPDITEDFWLFNDDFFVMKRVNKPCNYYNGDLYKRIIDIEDRHHRITPYTKQLRACCKELEALGCETKNYTLHVPMLINRQKALETLRIADNPMFRSIYANYHQIGGQQITDVKIVDPNKLWKDKPYLSTVDSSFAGALGKQIKELFPNKCRYEK